MTDASSSKQSLRETMLRRRRDLDEAEWRSRSEAVCRRLLEDVIQEDSTVLAFVTKDREVNLLSLFESAPEEVTFCLPRTDTDQRSLDVFCLESRVDLKKSLRDSRPVDSIVRGAYGIFEPDPDVSAPIELEELDVVLVPGLVFDGAGNRIGYGEGYYDNFLSSLPNRTKTIGVCFDEQLVSDILPVEGHDQPVERVVTDRRIQ